MNKNIHYGFLFAFCSMSVYGQVPSNNSPWEASVSYLPANTNRQLMPGDELELEFVTSTRNIQLSRSWNSHPNCVES